MSNFTALFASLPTCVQECMSFTLESAACDATAIPTCFCPSITAQKTFLGCAFESCNTTELLAAYLADKKLCANTPVQSRQKTIINVVIIMMAIVVPVVLLRCLFRWRIAKRLWWDDYMMIINMLLMIVLTAVSVTCVNKGFGLHTWNLSFEQVVHISDGYLLFWVGSLLYVVVQVLVKASILLFYIRVFPQRYLRIASWIMIVAFVVHGMIFFFVTLFQCRPLHSIWDITSSKSSCVSLGGLLIAGAAFSISEDLVILLLPIAEVSKLNMDWRKKVMVLFLFSIGIFACVTSMIRLKFTIGWHREIDATYDFTDVLLWSFIENSAAIVCASLPFLRPIFSAKPILVLGIGRKPSVFHGDRTFEPKVMDNGIYGKRFHGLDASHNDSSGESDTATGIAQSTKASEYSDTIPTKGSTPETIKTEGSRDPIAIQRQYDIV